jgi:hypothetical protein
MELHTLGVDGDILKRCKYEAAKVLAMADSFL